MEMKSISGKSVQLLNLCGTMYQLSDKFSQQRRRHLAKRQYFDNSSQENAPHMPQTAR